MPLTPDRAIAIYRDAFSDTRRERLFLSSVSFFTTFAATRVITHAIKDGVGPFHNLTVGGRHFHHLVIGITGLLGTGYLWLLEVDTSKKTNTTTNGSGNRRVSCPTVTLPSCIASRRADWVFGGVRLISSASRRFAKIGPA